MKILLILTLLLTGLQAGEKMNVLFIAVDDLKPMLGCYGFEEVKSPNIDKLANSGTLFTKNYCQWPVCGGSRASLMTGLYPESTGVMDLKTKMRDVNKNLLSMPEYFKQKGYQTTAVGKIFDPRCVDNKKDNDKPSWSIPFKQLPMSKIKHKSNKVFASMEDCKDTDMTDGVIAAEGVKLMHKLAKGPKPFFLAVGFKKPHLPFQAPKKYWDMYGRSKIELAKLSKEASNASIFGWQGSNEFRGYEGVPAKGPISEEIQKKAVHGYLACVSYIDAQVGLLMKNLKQLGLEKNTIIVFWGDHGFHLGDHSLWGKHTALEQAAICPLIIKVPGHKSAKVGATSGLIDIFPTLCEANGLEIPKVVEGVSQFPVIAGKSPRARKGIVTLFKSKGALGYSYRTEKYRYIEWIRRGAIEGIELFDYEKDPLEKVNIASTKPELVKKLSEQLRAEGQHFKKLFVKVGSK